MKKRRQRVTFGREPVTAITAAAVEAPPADEAATAEGEQAGPFTTWTAIMGYLGEATPTSDGRVLLAEGMTVRPLPLTLLFLPATPDYGHTGAYPIGTVEKVWTDGAKLMGSGTFDTSDESQEAARMIADQVQREISIDPIPTKYSYRYPLLELEAADGQEQVVTDADGNPVIEITEDVSDYLMTYIEWELGGVTVVSGAAFSNTEITVTADAQGRTAYPAIFPATLIQPVAADAFAPTPPAEGDGDTTPTEDDSEEQGAQVAAMIALYPAADEASGIARQGAEAAADLHCTLSVFLDPAPDATLIDGLLTDFASIQAPLSGDVTGVAVFAEGDEGVPVVALADVYGLNDLRADLCELLDTAGIPYATNHDFVPHLTLEYAAAPAQATSDDPALGQALTLGALSYVTADGTRTDYPLTGTWEEDDAAAVTASAAGLAPVEPPAEWFADPHFTGPTPIQVDDDGRIYGHFAPFGICHTARSGECLDAESLRSRTAYSYFNTGYVRCADGSEVAVGRLTLGTGHAPISMNARDTIAHYDDTGLVVAHVRAGEDAYGQYLVGALAPDTPAEKVRLLRGAALSGDWRPINGAAELVGVLAVNVGGFPLPRPEVEWAIAASGAPELVAGIGIAAGFMPGDPIPDELRLRTLRASMDGLDGLRQLIPT